MKILTKEEEAAHYNATLKGGFTGGFVGLAVVRIQSQPRYLFQTKLTESLRAVPHFM